jgi:hypothetical protein
MIGFLLLSFIARQRNFLSVKLPSDAIRSGSACLNSFPQLISGPRADCEWCGVVHGGVCRLDEREAAAGNSRRAKVFILRGQLEFGPSRRNSDGNN